MNNSNRNNLAVFKADGRNGGAAGLSLASLLLIVTGLMVCLVSSVRAADFRDDDQHDSDAIQIVSRALGLEELAQYSANSRAVGYGWANALGIEASYYDLGDSMFAKRAALDNNTENELGRRVDVKLAVDLSTPLAPRARLYSRVGVYLWDVDINYNRATRESNSSREGNSGMIGMGAALAVDGARLSFEYERLNPGAASDNRDPQRILMHVSSKF